MTGHYRNPVAGQLDRNGAMGAIAAAQGLAIGDARNRAVTAPGEVRSMTITGLISAIVIGVIIGFLGRLLLPGRQPIGILLTVVVGVGAAILGTWVAQFIGVQTTAGIDWIELVLQIVLAVVGVAIAARLVGRSA